MDQLVVRGGRPLHGTVSVGGAKNAALPIMAASLLTRGTITLNRIPRLADVDTMIRILRRLGCRADWAGPHTMRLSYGGGPVTTAPYDLVRQMRGSICVLGPLLAVHGAARLPLPGGCVLGPRPIDLHLKGLRALGARIETEEPWISGRAGRLRGARIYLAGPHGSTVLGTANVMMAATLAEGRTVIEHAACEPEVQDLAQFLVACGARISGIGTRTLTIHGVGGLHGAEHTLIPDRIQAGTLLAAAAATGGRVGVRGARSEHLRAPLEVMERMGVVARHCDGAIWATRRGRLRPANFGTAPYPGVPTDMHPQLAVLMCLADGTSIVREGVYPERFTHAAELNRMGARIALGEAYAMIRGVRELHPADVTAADLRAGGALLIAALAAPGTTVIGGVDQIDRGYEAVEDILSALGARVERRRAGPQAAPARKSA